MSGQRGILGMKKDPKNQVLFLLDGEDWPTSDSDDHDYEPGKTSSDLETYSPDESGKRTKRKKRLQKLPPSKRRKTTTDASEAGQSQSQSQRATRSTRDKKNAAAAAVAAAGPSGIGGATPGPVSAAQSRAPLPRLPVELWVNIFQRVMDVEGALPFLCRVAMVCREWWKLACLPCLWRQMDLSFGWIKSTDSTLKWLAGHRLSACREINLSGWKNLTNNGIKELAENCPDLEVINLSRCQKLSSDSVRVLADGCRKIRSIDVSFTSPFATTAGSLKYFVTQVGSTLKELHLAGNTQICFGPALKAIMTSCPYLETLDLSSTWINMAINVEELQESLPCLRTLGVGNCYFRSAVDDTECTGAGFENLEELSCAMSQEYHQFHHRGIPDSMLIRLLHKSHKLRLLDLRGCEEMDPWTSILTNCDQGSDITGLEELYLGRSSITNHCAALAVMLQQWAHSLRVLDLSRMTPSADSLEEAFSGLTAVPYPCVLTDLNLTASTVDTACVLTILKVCPSLQSLDLTSCRSLPRGSKGLHKGPEALQKLRSRLEASVDAHNAFFG